MGEILPRKYYEEAIYDFFRCHYRENASHILWMAHHHPDTQQYLCLYEMMQNAGRSLVAWCWIREYELEENEVRAGTFYDESREGWVMMTSIPDVISLEDEQKVEHDGVHLSQLDCFWQARDQVLEQVAKYHQEREQDNG